MLFFVLKWRQVAALHDNFTGKTAENLTFSDILCHFDRIRRVPSRARAERRRQAGCSIRIYM